MNKMQVLLIGVALASPLGLLTGCASSPIVQTKTVEVERPVHVAVPANLTEGVEDAPIPNVLTNDGLIGVAESEKCRRILGNCKLERIEALQPGGPRRAAKWCERQQKICRGVK